MKRLQPDIVYEIVREDDMVAYIPQYPANHQSLRVEFNSFDNVDEAYHDMLYNKDKIGSIERFNGDINKIVWVTCEYCHKFKLGKVLPCASKEHSWHEVCGKCMREINEVMNDLSYYGRLYGDDWWYL
jgi:hypothetical protein